MSEGLLVLEDGTVYHGEAIGRPGTSFGEIVFNTAMSGYQEVLTDPSYAGQIVVMTAAHVGNYGVRRDEAESETVHVAGFVARDFPERWSGTGGEESLASYLEEAGVTGLHGLDTRALVRHIRTQGAMRAGISTEIADPQELLRLVLGSPPMIGSDLALAVSPTRCSVFAAGSERFHVAAIDYGMKRNIIRLLNAAGCRVTVFPATAPAATILGAAPDGIFLSNGPGDPAALRSTDPHDRDPHREETDLRDLPRPPASRTRARGQDLQAEVRTSRARTIPWRICGRRRSRSRRRTTVSPWTAPRCRRRSSPRIGT